MGTYRRIRSVLRVVAGALEPAHRDPALLPRLLLLLQDQRDQRLLPIRRLVRHVQLVVRNAELLGPPGEGAGAHLEQAGLDGGELGLGHAVLLPLRRVLQVNVRRLEPSARPIRYVERRETEWRATHAGEDKAHVLGGVALVVDDLPALVDPLCHAFRHHVHEVHILILGMVLRAPHRRA